MIQTMATSLAFGFVCCVFQVLIENGLAWGKGQVDLIRSPGANGPDVVDAVIDLIHHACTFEDDKFLLRRLAFIESRDGTNGNTYRTGYNGGIWQIDEDKFLQTQTSSYARKYFSDIRLSNLKIDWSRVTWTDLRKPLHSGLAARLYIEVMNRGQDIPREISEQAQLWHLDYHKSNPAPTSSFTANAELITQSCSGNKALDAVFILDSSGSVDVRDFEKAKQFVIKWIEAYQIGPDATQLAVISYSTGINIEFDLNTYHTISELISRVKRIQYMGGGTNTADAIKAAVDHSLSTQYGARNNVERAAILVTANKSSNRTATVMEAEHAHKMQITLFAVGVGTGVDIDELRDVATDPDCTHVFLVRDFSKIQDLKQQMQEAHCQTKIHVPELITTSSGSANTAVNCVGVSCEIPLDVNTTTDAGSKEAFVVNRNKTLTETTVNCGNATVYAAYNNSNPRVTLYEIKSTATRDTPAMTRLLEIGRTLLLTVDDHPYRLYVSSNDTIVCEAESKVVPTEEVQVQKVGVVCEDHGLQRECTPTDLIGFKDGLCAVSWEFPNPCTREHLLDGKLKFRHPHHVDRYLMCDFAGNVYIVQCPKGHVYNQAQEACKLGPGTR